jgi:hypothetical protein
MDSKDISNILRCTNLNDESEFILIEKGSQSNVAGKFLKSHFSNLSTSGQKGEVGEKGEPGLKGFVGAKGQIGIVGELGDRGVTGDKGYKGFSGIKGLSGDVGEIGDPANNGQDGPQGKTGTKGTRGNRGIVGDLGDFGETGPAGYTGLKGFRGDKGNDASVVYGSDGYVGIPGKKVGGSKGYKGFRGTDSNVQGDKGRRGPYGDKFTYESTYRSFKETNFSPRKHGRVLLLLTSTGNSSSISITTNSVLTEYRMKRRFLVFELSNSNNNLVYEKYSNLYVEVDFEPFNSLGECPVVTKTPPLVVRNGNEVGTIGMDWYKDLNGEYHIMFFGIFTNSTDTVQIPIKTIYSYTSNHLYDVISGEYENLRI